MRIWDGVTVGLSNLRVRESNLETYEGVNLVWRVNFTVAFTNARVVYVDTENLYNKATNPSRTTNQLTKRTEGGKKKEWLAKEKKRRHQKKSCKRGVASPALILSGLPFANSALATSKTVVANNVDISLSNEYHLESINGSVHAWALTLHITTVDFSER